VKNNAENLSIIDKGLKIDGSISSEGNLVIRGCIKGSLSGERIVIAEEGSVFADTDAASLTIGGIFEGEVRASEELIILSTGSCAGSVVCKNLVIESGGLLNASVSYSATRVFDKTGKVKKPSIKV
jgi:cytoskeletal protein CcmA (bactofilin family)